MCRAPVLAGRDRRAGGARPRLQVLAKAQRERLQVMLDEIKGRSSDSEERYRAALDGRSLGTHSVGTSVDAVAIKAGTAAAAEAGKEQPPTSAR